jgi:hypothetical protein
MTLKKQSVNYLGPREESCLQSENLTSNTGDRPNQPKDGIYPVKWLTRLYSKNQASDLSELAKPISLRHLRTLAIPETSTVRSGAFQDSRERGLWTTIYG